MGHRTKNRHHRLTTMSHTLPSSPTHSSSSSDFEFTISASPRKSSAADLCPADDLFYKGQLLPLHPSPRLSMVRTLLLSSSSTSSSSDTTTTASRDSTSSSSADCDSSRPSSATDDEFKRLTCNTATTSCGGATTHTMQSSKKSLKYFSLPKFFRKDQKTVTPATVSGSGAAAKRVSSSAKDVIYKYLKKVKPLYEKLSQKQQQQQKASPSPSPPPPPPPPPTSCRNDDNTLASISHSFSGNLRYPRGRSCFSSCPSSMGSSPSRNGSGFGHGSTETGRIGSDASSMEELQNAIQGAILHCKNSMLQNKTILVSNEI